MKSLPFYIPEAWKRHPFRAKPPRVGHYREYPSPPGVSNHCLMENNTTDSRASRPCVLIDSGDTYANSVRKITSVFISFLTVVLSSSERKGGSLPVLRICWICWHCVTWNAFREISKNFSLCDSYQAKITHVIRSFLIWEKFSPLLYLFVFSPDILRSCADRFSLLSKCRKYSRIKEKPTATENPNLCLWGAWKFPPKNLRPEKMPRAFATKI